MTAFDTVIRNGQLVIPYVGVREADIGICDGKVASISRSIPASEASSVIDARGRHVLPGAVDSHYHVGIYRPHAQDAETESQASLVGGVTTILSYFRTGHNYLNRSGPYAEIFPEVLRLSEGHFYTDYAYHLAIMTDQQLDEVEMLISEYGVTSFKFYMFYKSLTLAGDSTSGDQYTMTTNYDLGHLYLLMERIASVAAKSVSDKRVSLSLHCENPELIRIFIEKVKRDGLTGLRAHSEARPPLTEKLSIHEAAILADATECPINFLHLSSREALKAACDVQREYPELDIINEVTLHHLALSYDKLEGVQAKVNPPIRTNEDCESLWRGIVQNRVDTVVSDHACCQEEFKDENDLWGSLPGFGGSSLIYPVLISEGHHRRSLPLTKIAELASANPARHFGLYPDKGTIVVGGDADFAIVDIDRTQRVTSQMLRSAQEYSPFEGIELKGWPSMTIVRGQTQYLDGSIVGQPTGQFVRRNA